MKKIKVGIVGYGTIGKRVADAVLLQEDMELIGVTMRSYNYKIEMAIKKGIPLYALDYDDPNVDKSVKVEGDMNDLLDKIDVVIDCAPGKIGRENKKLYKEKGIKSIFQGGEGEDIADMSFSACCTYDKAINKDCVRVVSCGTTALCRVLKLVEDLYGVESSRVTLVRRATDPWDSKKGPINAIEPCLEVPSHHGPDVMTVMPHIDVFTTAVKVPTTLMHLHCLSIKTKTKPDAEKIKEEINKRSRIRLVKGKAKIKTTSDIMEMAKDLGNSRGDLMEICVWDESIVTKDNEVFLIQAIHQESDVVPENIDAIRAMMGFKDREKSMEMTDKSLGLI